VVCTAGGDGTAPHTVAGGQNSPVQSPSPGPVPPGCKLPGNWQFWGAPALRVGSSQLMGSPVLMEQPAAYTAAATCTVRGAGDVRVPHLESSTVRGQP
jgi:hypothetical protein